VYRHAAYAAAVTVKIAAEASTAARHRLGSRPANMRGDVELSSVSDATANPKSHAD
jgi:hypothetical protein